MHSNVNFLDTKWAKSRSSHTPSWPRLDRTRSWGPCSLNFTWPCLHLSLLCLHLSLLCLHLSLSTPKPIMSTPQPIMSTPQPIMSTPQPIMSTPQPIMSTPQPILSTPQPILSTPQPIMSTPQPIILDLDSSVSRLRALSETNTFQFVLHYTWGGRTELSRERFMHWSVYRFCMST